MVSSRFRGVVRGFAPTAVALAVMFAALPANAKILWSDQVALPVGAPALTEPLPAARFGAASAVVASRIYVIGGFTGSSVVTNTTYEYNPATVLWSAPLAPMTTSRAYAGCAVGVNGVGATCIYVIGGLGAGGVVLNAVQEYNPLTNTWTARAVMPTARMGFACATDTVNNKIYAIGGFTATAPAYVTTAVVEEYNPATNAWAAKAPMTVARGFLRAEYAGDTARIYALGGAVAYTETPSKTATGTTANEAYNPVGDTWATMTALPDERCMMGSAVAETDLTGARKIFLVGGVVSNSVVGTVDVYHPAGNTWTASGETSMSLARANPALQTVTNRLYAIGGDLFRFSTVFDTNEEGIVRGIRVSPTALTLGLGGTTTFLAQSTNAADAFVWSSNAAATASVDANGVVTAVAFGTATITATGTVSAPEAGTGTITVEAAGGGVVGVAPSPAVVRVSGTHALAATSKNPSDVAFSWSSSNTAVAAVDAAGVVTGVGVGSAMITATGNVSGETGGSVVYVDDDGFIVVPQTLTMKTGGTYKLTALSDLVGETFSWSSSDSGIASPDGTGLVTAGATSGSAAVTATGSSGRSATATVTVDEAAGSVVATAESASVNPNANSPCFLGALRRR